MLKCRIIPCLDVANGRVVKGINFVGLRDAGDPVEAAERYERFTGKTAELRGGGYRIPLDRGEIVICASDTCSELLQDVDIPELPFIAAVSVASEDIAKTRSYLLEANVPLFENSDNRLITNSRSGMGAQFVFHSFDQEPFPLL